MDRKSLWAGLAIGVGAGWLARALAPSVAPWVRPAAKSSLKSAIRGLERGRELASAWAEDIEDAIPEVQSDLARERREEPGSGDGSEGGGRADPSSEDAPRTPNAGLHAADEGRS